MDDRELEILLNDIESDRVERKASMAHPDEIREAVCAFANDLPNHRRPGVLFIGVNNDGSCAHLPITDELQRNLAHMRSDGNLLPFPTMIVQKKTLGGCELAVIIVEPSDAPPVRYKGRVWVRVGPRRAIATAEEERRLAEKRRAKDLPFDLQPVSSATLEDLDTDLFCRVYLPAALPAEILEQNQRATEQQLTSMRFATAEPQPKPTILGILVVGIVALQQLARNAVMHRTYDGTNAPIRITWFSDRIEIQNPGGPFGQVNRQNFGQPGITDYRNPHLAEAMKNLGYVQRFGIGIQLARKELEKNSNPPPEFAPEDAHVLVIVRRRP